MPAWQNSWLYSTNIQAHEISPLLWVYNLCFTTMAVILPPFFLPRKPSLPLPWWGKIIKNCPPQHWELTDLCCRQYVANGILLFSNACAKTLGFRSSKRATTIEWPSYYIPNTRLKFHHLRGRPRCITLRRYRLKSFVLHFLKVEGSPVKTTMPEILPFLIGEATVAVAAFALFSRVFLHLLKYCPV